MSLLDVQRAIRQVRVHLREYHDPRLGGPANGDDPANDSEMSTRYIVVDPVLRSLGWDLSDPSQCMVERVAGPQGKSYHYPRVDYALLGSGGRAVVLVEAKRLMLSLRMPGTDDRHEKSEAEWVKGRGQLRRYLRRFQRVEVGVLTNGQEWEIFCLRMTCGNRTASPC